MGVGLAQAAVCLSRVGRSSKGDVVRAGRVCVLIRGMLCLWKMVTVVKVYVFVWVWCGVVFACLLSWSTLDWG